MAMLRGAGRTGLIAFAIWAVGATAVYAATLVVQVRTDLVPGRDFDEAVSTIRGVSNSTVRRINKSAHPGENWRRGVRVAEFRLDDGNYRLMVGLRHRRIGMRTQRPARVTLKGGVRVLTILLTCPPGGCPSRSRPDARGGTVGVRGRGSADGGRTGSESRARTDSGSASASPPPMPRLARPPAGSLTRTGPGGSAGPLPQVTGPLSRRASCGGPNHAGCGQGEYCALAVGKCRNPNAKGTCRKRPSCFSGAATAPVCGCDRKTYPNSCVAAANGVNVLHKGRCRSIGRDRR
jgi:hypothetical protein